MIINQDGDMTDAWRASGSHVTGALSYLEASQLLIRLGNSLGVRKRNKNTVLISFLKVRFSS